VDIRLLHELNPWAGPYRSRLRILRPSEIESLAAPFPTSRGGEPGLAPLVEARRRFHTEMLARPASAWNRWAAQMQSMKPKPSLAGRDWALWQAFAHVDLAGLHISREADFSGRQFPGACSFTDAVFERDAYVSGAQFDGPVRGSSAEFRRDCWLDQCRFADEAALDGIGFGGRVEARANQFGGTVDLSGSSFARDCWFSGSRFGGKARVEAVRFRSDAGFSACIFESDASFDDSLFDDTVGMEQATFAGDLSLKRVAFAKAIFFDGAVFAREPRIDGATFARAPSLAGASFPDEAPRPAVANSDGSPLRRAATAA
jgi:hypothetical protein